MFQTNNKRTMVILLFIINSCLCSIEKIPKQGYPSIYIEGNTLIFLNDSIYTFGGIKNNELTSFLKSFDILSRTWSDISPSSQNNPLERTDSSSFTFNNNL